MAMIPLLTKRNEKKEYTDSNGGKHRVPWSFRNKANSERKAESQAIYNTPTWKGMRQAVMLRDNALCQRCLNEFDRVTPATQVHHIKPFLNYQGDERLKAAFDYGNVICLCDKCHFIVHHYPKQNGKYIK